MPPPTETSTAAGNLTVGARLAEMDKKLDALTASMTEVVTKTGADYQRHKRHEQRLDKLESWQTWALRLIVGAIVLGVIAMAYRT